MKALSIFSAYIPYFLWLLWYRSHRKSCKVSTETLTPFYSGDLGVQISGATNTPAAVSVSRTVYPDQLKGLWPLTCFCRDKKWKVKISHQMFCCLLSDSDLWGTLKPGRTRKRLSSHQSFVCKPAPAHWFGDRGFVSHVGTIEGDPGLRQACAQHMYSTSGWRNIYTVKLVNIPSHSWAWTVRELRFGGCLVLSGKENVAQPKHHKFYPIIKNSRLLQLCGIPSLLLLLTGARNTVVIKLTQ